MLMALEIIKEDKNAKVWMVYELELMTLRIMWLWFDYFVNFFPFPFSFLCFCLVMYNLVKAIYFFCHYSARLVHYYSE